MPKPESKAESRWSLFRKELKMLVHKASEARWHKRQISRARRRAEREDLKRHEY